MIRFEFRIIIINFGVIKMKKIKYKHTIIIISIICFSCIYYLNSIGITFSQEKAIQASSIINGDNIEIIERVKMDSNKDIVMFVNPLSKQFGISEIHKFLGGLMVTQGDISYSPENTQKPFNEIGRIHSNGSGWLGFKINDSNLKYIAIKKTNVNPIKNEQINLEMVKNNPDLYMLKEVNGKHLLFCWSEHKISDFYNIIGFDKSGNLIFDKSDI